MKAPNWRLMAIIFASLTGCTLVIARGLVTPLGKYSFGRVWMYEVSYLDFGFLRRAFVGTAVDLTGLDFVVADVGTRSYLLHLSAIVAILSVVAVYAVKRRPPLWAVATLVLSPAFVLQAAYTTGTLDVYVLLIVTVLVLLRPSSLVTALLCGIGVLIHELFVFALPFIIATRWLVVPEDGTDRVMTPPAHDIAAIIGASLVATVAVLWAGALRIGRVEYESALSPKLGDWAHVNELWSGYFEVSSSAAENLRVGVDMLPGMIQVESLMVALYLTLCVTTAVRMQSAQGSLARCALIATVLAPLLATVVAMDHYRWFGMSASFALLTVLMSSANRDWRHLGSLRPSVLALLLFAALAPLGSLPGRAFPLHQFVIEKLGIL